MMSGASSLRFWGKIYGKQKDYWILEGILDHQEQENVEKNIEKRGEGVNKHVYWVTDNILNDWVQLPDCNPDWVLIARQIKYIFSGNLN